MRFLWKDISDMLFRGLRKIGNKSTIDNSLCKKRIEKKKE